MTFFESLLLLLLAAIVLLQIARRLKLPYPAMLALAGVAVAFIPGGPDIPIDPQTALALFIAPVLLDAAYAFPLAIAKMLWRPVFVLAVGAVLITTAVVAFIGWWAAGLPIAAAIVMGAIVAPSDAAAAVAVIDTIALPRRTAAVLKGESLFNDATALLLFSGALTVQLAGGLTATTGGELAIAIPGGLMLGVVLGEIMNRLARFAGNTLGANLLQFINAFAVWIIAERLHLSAVLAVVACAMTVARSTDAVDAPRMRIHSFAVWSSVVFLLNVVGFLLLGMQGRKIVAGMTVARLWESATVAGLVILAVIVARMAVVVAWRFLAVRFRTLRGEMGIPPLRQTIVVGWSGMRGLVTLATAFALPTSFPQRDLVTLVAFAVVLATLVLQGFSLAPLIRVLGLHEVEDPEADLSEARREMAVVGLRELERRDDGDDLNLRELYTLESDSQHIAETVDGLTRYRNLGLAIVRDQRACLLRMRDDQSVDMDGYDKLQEEIDWRQLSLLPDDERRMEEI